LDNDADFEIDTSPYFYFNERGESEVLGICSTPLGWLRGIHARWNGSRSRDPLDFDMVVTADAPIASRTVLGASG
jgi:hypothetical protein